MMCHWQKKHLIIMVVKRFREKCSISANILETGVSCVNESKISKNACFRGRKWPIRSENAQNAPVPILYNAYFANISLGTHQNLFFELQGNLHIILYKKCSINVSDMLTFFGARSVRLVRKSGLSTKPNQIQTKFFKFTF